MFHSLRLCHAILPLARHQLETPSAIGMAWHGLVSCHTASTPVVDVTPQRMRPLGVFTMFPGRRLNKVATMVNDSTDIHALLHERQRVRWRDGEGVGAVAAGKGGCSNFESSPEF